MIRSQGAGGALKRSTGLSVQPAPPKIKPESQEVPSKEREGTQRERGKADAGKDE